MIRLEPPDLVVTRWFGDMALDDMAWYFDISARFGADKPAIYILVDNTLGRLLNTNPDKVR